VVGYRTGKPNSISVYGIDASGRALQTSYAATRLPLTPRSNTCAISQSAPHSNLAGGLLHITGITTQ
jgi:hypothetical protein